MNVYAAASSISCRSTRNSYLLRRHGQLRLQRVGRARQFEFCTTPPMVSPHVFSTHDVSFTVMNYFVCVAVGEVNPNSYGKWKGQLPGAKADYAIMKKLVDRTSRDGHNLIFHPLWNPTCKDFFVSSEYIARQAMPGDLIVFYFSAHGSQVPNTNRDDEDLDNVICLCDRMLIDDELAIVWTLFPAQVRILVLVDACHSGSALKALFARGRLDPPVHVRQAPDDRIRKTYLQHEAFYVQRQQEISQALSSADTDTAASVLQISACADGELAIDGPNGGDFTRDLVRGLSEGGNDSYRALHQWLLRKHSRYAPARHPQWRVRGRADEYFYDHIRPFYTESA